MTRSRLALRCKCSTLFFYSLRPAAGSIIHKMYFLSFYCSSSIKVSLCVQTSFDRPHATALAKSGRKCNFNVFPRYFFLFVYYKTKPNE